MLFNFFIMCVCVHVHVRGCVNTAHHTRLTENKDQLLGVSSPSTIWVQGSESGRQDWPREPLPVEPSIWPNVSILGVEIGHWLLTLTTDCVI